MFKLDIIVFENIQIFLFMVLIFMMYLLIPDIGSYFINAMIVNRKHTATSLPLEALIVKSIFIDPFGGVAFDPLNKNSRRHGGPQAGSNMDVIRHAIDLDGGLV